MVEVSLNTGQLTTDQLNAIFQTIPQEFDFIDENDIIRWYSDNTARLFQRSKAALNQHVLDVHPKHSAHRVEAVLAQMHEGVRSSIEMIVPVHGKQVQICFYALHHADGRYLGCIEVTQDVTKLAKTTRIKNIWNLLRQNKT